MDKKSFRRQLVLMTARKDWDQNESLVAFVNQFVMEHEKDPLEDIEDFMVLTKSDVERLFEQGVTKKSLLYAARQKNQHLDVRYFLRKNGFISELTK
jgi:hypothetical protein